MRGIGVVGARSLRQTVALLTGLDERDEPPVPPPEDVPSILWKSAD
jgi:magnesium chelatase family protein